MASDRMYRSALVETTDRDMLYPSLAGHADWALPFIGKMVRLLGQEQFAHPHSQEYFRSVIRDAADEYTFTTEFARARGFYELHRSEWVDEEADAIGAAYLRAYRDMIPAGTEDVPF